MARLKKMLSDKQKKLRTRNNTLNLQITVLGWLVEVFGFMSTIVGVYILGHGNSIVTMILHTISMINYFIILPCSLLINSSDVKEYILDHNLYLNFLNWFEGISLKNGKKNDGTAQVKSNEEQQAD